MRSWRRLVVIVLFVGAIVLQADPGGAATPAGGTVRLVDPIRYVDTRGGPPSNGPFGLPSFGMMFLIASTSGSATVYPCGGIPGSDPSVVFEANEVVWAKTAAATPLCIVSSVPADFVADTLGFVLPEPTTDGLQYVALPAPVVVDNGANRAFDERRFDLGAIPDAAKAAVLLMESLDPTQAGYASAYSCARRPLTSDMSWTNRRDAGIAYATLTPGSSELCSYVYGMT